MTISIYHATLRHNGTPCTLMQTVHVPNWFERVILRKARVKVNYIGHKQNWKHYPDGLVLPLKEGKRLAAIETRLIAIGRKEGKRILKFR